MKKLDFRCNIFIFLYCIFRNTTRKTTQCDLTEENRSWTLKEIIFGASTITLILIIIVMIITVIACRKSILAKGRNIQRKKYIYTYINSS